MSRPYRYKLVRCARCGWSGNTDLLKYVLGRGAPTPWCPRCKLNDGLETQEKTGWSKSEHRLRGGVVMPLREIEKEKDRMIMDMYKQGYIIKDIARRMGCCHQNISRRLAALREEGRVSYRRPPR